MSKTILVLFWVMWLLDVLIALYGYWEFMGGMFGHNSNPSSKYITLWVGLLAFAMLIIGGSLYFKNQGYSFAALSVAAVPLILALPYVLYLAVVMVSSNGNWR